MGDAALRAPHQEGDNGGPPQGRGELFDTVFKNIYSGGTEGEPSNIEAVETIDNDRILLEHFRARKARELAPSEGATLYPAELRVLGPSGYRI